MDLKGRSAIVTGASRGIGRSIARTYAEHGAQVVACARNREGLQALKSECQSVPGKIRYLVADVIRADDRQKLVDTALDGYGKIDILVNNAGVLGPRLPVADYPDGIWEQVIDVNLNAVFHLTKLALRPMLQRKSGRVINITSGAGIHGSARWGAYAVSKFGVEGLTQILADELNNSGIEVNAVNPGPIATEMRAEAYPEEDPATLPSPDDIMDVFLFLASENGKGNNGTRFEAQEFSLPAVGSR